jgi:peptidoglycan/xylan/chitin deacetylase (PgdA/CDA1 family)
MRPSLQTFYIWRRKADYLRRDICALLGLTAHSFKTARGARIVVYHGICRQQPLRFNNIFLTRDAFEEHLRFYNQYFNLVSLEDYYQQRFDKNRLNICIHFDDGHATNYTEVLPLLHQYNAPAAFFITAIREAGYDILWNDFLGMLTKYGPKQLSFRGQTFRKRHGRFPQYLSLTDNISLRQILIVEGFDAKAELIDEMYPLAPFRDNPPDKDYWLQMTTAQIKELSASPWATIGAHGYYHNDLTKMTTAAAEQEMRASKQYLEKLTGKPVTAFAFPYGTYSSPLVAAAKRAAFTRILPLHFDAPESATDPALRERIIINPYVSLPNQMFNLIKKRYDFWR